MTRSSFGVETPGTSRSALLPTVLRLIVVLGCALLLHANPARSGEAASDAIQFPTCGRCGMNRQLHSFSRMLVHYDDGSLFASCSLHCVALDLAVRTDRTPVAILVGEFGTGRLIDAESAHWVVGGARLGVMTRRAKWAFEKEKDALNFQSENGGVLSTFEEAMQAAYDGMYTDTRMIRAKRKLRRMFQ